MKQCMTASLVLVFFFNLAYSQSIPVQDGILLVTHNTGSMISFIDLKTGTTIDTAATDEGPYCIAVSPDGSTAVVSNYGHGSFGSSLTVIDIPARSAAKTIKLPPFCRPHGIAFLPDGETVIVTLEDYNSVAVVDIISGEVEKIIETGQAVGHMLAVDSEDNRAYVSNIDSNTVTVIDLQTYQIIKHIGTGKGPEGIDISPDGSQVWVANRYDNTISIISTERLDVTGTIDAGYYPTRLKFTPDGRYVFVTMPRWGEVFLFDAQKKVYMTYYVPDIVLEEYEQKDKLLVHGNSVAVKRMDASNRRERIGRLKKGIGPMPSEILISPDGRYAYITSRNSDLIAVLLLNRIELPVLHSFIKSSRSPDGMAILTSDNHRANPAAAGPQNIDEEPLDEYRPEIKYFKSLEAADSLEFAQKFEYPFLLVLTDDEKEQYQSNKSIAAGKQYITRYIKSRNLNPLYSVNYWYLEFSGRCSYALREFAIDEPPYFDERGEYYIKYGEPDTRFTSNGGGKKSEILGYRGNFTIKTITTRNIDLELAHMYVNGQPEIYFQVYPNETWNYTNSDQQITVHFAKKQGKWQKIESLEDALRTQDRRKKNMTWQWMELVKERSHVATQYASATSDIMDYEYSLKDANIFIDRTVGGQFGVQILMVAPPSLGFISDMEPHLPMMKIEEDVVYRESNLLEGLEDNNIDNRYNNINHLPLDYDIAQFKGTDGNTRIELVAYASIEGITKNRLTPDPSDTVSVEYTYVARDSEYNTLFRGESIHTFSSGSADENKITHSMAVQTAQCSPFSGDFTMQVRDVYSNNVGFLQDSVVIRDFSGNGLMLSDVQFYNPVMQPSSEKIQTVVNIEGASAVPIVSNKISRGNAVYCYFELYNIKSSGIGAFYEIDFRLKKIDKKNRIHRFLERITGSDAVTMSVKSTRQVINNNENELLSVDLSRVDSGDYLVEITVTNPENISNTASITRLITITDK